MSHCLCVNARLQNAVDVPSGMGPRSPSCLGAAARHREGRVTSRPAPTGLSRHLPPAVGAKSAQSRPNPPLNATSAGPALPAVRGPNVPTPASGSASGPGIRPAQAGGPGDPVRAVPHPARPCRRRSGRGRGTRPSHRGACRVRVSSPTAVPWTDLAIATCNDVWGEYKGTRLQCDQYPFASTKEGAAAPGNSYSARLVDGTDNETGGRKLNEMFTLNRILDGDAFYVKITP
ncbi:NucA/NucB deoxyribonuclease domain-containing protein [Streptomyces sp. NPDC023588]|uniref:NucA/NucB deoxyribonuclease domain-containing protein n=1 Tax=Streptomyces sp. NPDC023588 TaxID=3154907 RepID=UPI0033CA81E8